MGKLFGTDGVRGIANKELTAELAYKIGQAGAIVLTKETKHRPKILVGKDTRISGDMLEAALVAGICSVGGNVVILGVIPTPAVAHLTRLYKADAGVVISASHNPMEFNGIKYFDSEGLKLKDEIENEIEDIIFGKEPMDELPIGKDLGKVEYNKDTIKDYVDFAVSTVDIDLKGLKIALDCANGASYLTAPMVMQKLGAEVHVINNTPDGSNINLNCGSTHMEELQKFVVDKKCDIGLAFDGDADRVLAVNSQGEIVDGDQIMTVCSLDMMNRGLLHNNTLVATVMSNLGLFIMAKEKGLNVLQTKVGDRYVLEEMLKHNYSMGGEQSGHIIFLEHNTTGDGIVSALQLLSVLKRSNKQLKELTSVMQIMPQVLVNAKVQNKYKDTFMNHPEISKKMSELEEIFDGNGRVLIRPSGTEPLVRVMIEGKDIDFITEKAKELANLIEREYME